MGTQGRFPSNQKLRSFRNVDNPYGNFLGKVPENPEIDEFPKANLLKFREENQMKRKFLLRKFPNISVYLARLSHFPEIVVILKISGIHTRHFHQKFVPILGIGRFSDKATSRYIAIKTSIPLIRSSTLKDNSHDILGEGDGSIRKIAFHSFNQSRAELRAD